MHSPCLAEHGAKTKGKSRHQDPCSSSTDVREAFFVRQIRVQAKKNDRDIGQNATNNNQIIHVWRRHFDLPKNGESV